MVLSWPQSHSKPSSSSPAPSRSSTPHPAPILTSSLGNTAPTTTTSISASPQDKEGEDQEEADRLVAPLRKVSFESSVSLPLTSTTSSSSSSSSSAASSIVSSFASVVKRSHHHHHSHDHQPLNKSPSLPTYKLDSFSSPQELVETAISVLLTIPGPSMMELEKSIIPKLYHPAYSHRVNARELTLAQVLDVTKLLRSRFRSLRIKFTRTLMDADGTATLSTAALGLTYDLIAIRHRSPNRKKGETHEEEDAERRTSAIAVVKIFESRLAQSDVAIDTLPLYPGEAVQKPQLDCCIS